MGRGSRHASDAVPASNADALSYPKHYPPKTRWKKFFIGVRGLGSDLSFFDDLNAQQVARVPAMMNAWATVFVASSSRAS
jgi:hypothetical protein